MGLADPLEAQPPYTPSVARVRRSMAACLSCDTILRAGDIHRPCLPPERDEQRVRSWLGAAMAASAAGRPPRGWGRRKTVSFVRRPARNCRRTVWPEARASGANTDDGGRAAGDQLEQEGLWACNTPSRARTCGAVGRRSGGGRPACRIGTAPSELPAVSLGLLHPTTPARSSMACNNTLHPAVICAGLASSISLWLMPSLHGMKIMPAGARRAM